MWFIQAAEKLVEEYDVPNDHDGPRHFEYGLGLMVLEMLHIIRERRGNVSAEKTANHIISCTKVWIDTRDDKDPDDD